MGKIISTLFLLTVGISLFAQGLPGSIDPGSIRLVSKTEPKGEVVKSGTILMKNGIIGQRGDALEEYGFYLYYKTINGVFPKSQVTIKDGSVHDLEANVSTLWQNIFISKGTKFPNEDIVMLKRGDTLIYRIDGEYNQILKTNGEVSLGVVKFFIHDPPPISVPKEIGSKPLSRDDMQRALLESFEKIKQEGEVELKYELREQLFLISEGKRYSPTERNFIKLFDDRKDDIKRYLKENNVKLLKNAEITELFGYLSE